MLDRHRVLSRLTDQQGRVPDHAIGLIREHTSLALRQRCVFPIIETRERIVRLVGVRSDVLFPRTRRAPSPRAGTPSCSVAELLLLRR
jgi:hypothetical protein